MLQKHQYKAKNENEQPKYQAGELSREATKLESLQVRDQVHGQVDQLYQVRYLAGADAGAQEVKEHSQRVPQRLYTETCYVHYIHDYLAGSQELHDEDSDTHRLTDLAKQVGLDRSNFTKSRLGYESVCNFSCVLGNETETALSIIDPVMINLEVWGRGGVPPSVRGLLDEDEASRDEERTCIAIQQRQPASAVCIATVLYEDGTAHRSSIAGPPSGGHFSDTTDDPCLATSYCTRGKGQGKGGGDQLTGDQLTGDQSTGDQLIAM